MTKQASRLDALTAQMYAKKEIRDMKYFTARVLLFPVDPSYSKGYNKREKKHESSLTTMSWGPFLESPENFFGPEKPFVKLRPAYSIKLVYSYVVKGIKIKITAKFHASRRLRFEDTKRIMSPEMHPKTFGTFEKRAAGLKVITCMSTSISVTKCPLSL